MLYGNEGQSNNKYFTYQMDAIINVPSSRTLRFGATCSMWVGVCTGTTCSTELSWTAASSASPSYSEQTFTVTPGVKRIWVNYAHNCQTAPRIRMQLPNVMDSSRSCDVTSAGLPVAGLYPFSISNLNRKNILQTADNTIYLTKSTQSDTATAAWHPTKIDLRRGFSASFDFAVSSYSAGSYTGFAFVIQNSNSQAQGDAGSQHFNAITKGLVIEIQLNSATTFTPRIRTRFDGQSSYTTAASLSSRTIGTSTVYIEYDALTRSVKTTIAGSSLTATVDNDSIFSMWDDLAWAGFTSGVAGGTLNIEITNWRIKSLQASGALSTIPSNGVIWAQYGQHDQQGSPAASNTAFTRLTDNIASTYTVNNNITISTGASFASYNPSFTSGTPSKKLEIVYFQDGTMPRYQSVAFTTAGAASETFSVQTGTGVLSGTAALVPADTAYSTLPSYYLVPMDGCGNPTFVSASAGLATVASAWTGTLSTASSVVSGGTFPTLTCSGGTKISVKYASYCGVDMTSSIGTTCDASASCTPSGLTCTTLNSWENNRFSASYECYDSQPTVVRKVSTSPSSVGVDSISFGFYQDMYGLFVQRRTAGSYSADVRFNADSIGSFSASVGASSVSETQTTYQTFATSFTAGTTRYLRIYAKDAFGNNVTDTGVSFTVSFDQIASTFSSTYLYGNVFQVAITLTQTISSMQMYIRVDSKDIVSSPLSGVSVSANTATTAFASLDSSTMTAATSGGVTATLSLQDQYGNAVTSGSVDVRAVIVGVNTFGTTTFTANSFTGSNVVVNNINHNTAGAYTIEYYLNSAKLTSTSAVTVTPAAAATNQFTLTSSGSQYSVGGAGNYFTVQTRDQYGNALTSSGSSFSVVYDPPSGSDVTVSCPSASCVYFTQGAYRAAFTPTVSGSWSVKATGSEGDTSSTAFTVNPGALSTSSELAVQTTYVHANADATFQVTAKDSQGNTRTQVTDDGSSFVVTISSLNNSATGTVNSVSSGSSGVYTFTWRAAVSDCAGTYRVVVQLTGGQAVANPTNVDIVAVVPAHTTAIKSNSLFGPGLSGGAQGTAAWFEFSAADAYDNLQLSTQSDSFSVTSDESIGASVNPTAAGNVYMVNYTMPSLNVASPGFTIEVFLNSTQKVATVNPTVIQTDNDATKAQLQAGYPTTINPDTPATFTVRNLDNSGNIQQTQRTFYVDFYSGSVSNGRYNTLIPSCTTGDQNTAAAETCDVTVNTADTKHLSTAGTYIMRLRVGTKTYSPTNYSITVETGNPSSSQSRTSLDVSTIAAGGTVNLRATVYDAYGNQYTAGSLSVSFLVTGSGSTQCTSGCTVTATWSSSNSRYEATFQPTEATTFSIIGKQNTLELGSVQSLVVTAGSADATQSSISSISSNAPGGIYIVDYTISANVQLKDQYGNAVINSPAAFTAALASNGARAVTVSETATLGTYQVTTSPNVSSVYDSANTAATLAFTVQIGGTNVQQSPQNLIVQPGDVDAAQSSVTSILSTNTAGTYQVVNFTLQDSYGNAWKQDPTLLRVSQISPTQVYTSLSFGSSSPFQAPVPKGNGEISYRMMVTEGNVKITYRLEFISAIFGNYTEVAISSLSSAETFTVAGSASAAQTVVTKASSTNANDPQDGLSPFEANFYALTNLTLYDQYGNARFTNATGDADVTVRLDGHLVNDYGDSLLPAAFICSNNMNYFQHIPSFEVTKNFTTSVVCNSMSECLVTLRGQRAGNFRMLVFVNNVGAYCYQFTVNPGPGTAMGTFIAGVGTVDNTGITTTCTLLDADALGQQSVGGSNCAVVQVADSFGNYLTGNVSEAIALGAPTQGTSYCNNIVAAGSNYIINSSTYLGQGRYMVPFSSLLIGEVNVTATFDGYAVGSDYTSCKEVTFKHWYPYRFQTTVSPITTTADVPSRIAISSQDVFGNNVTTGSFFFGMSLSARGGRSYSISVTRSTALVGLQVLDFRSQWPGEYRAVITLTDPDFQGPQYGRATAGEQSGFTLFTNVTVLARTCAGQNSATPYRCGDDPETDSCASAYSGCTGVTVCNSSHPIYCEASAACVRVVGDCQCSTSGTMRCADGACVSNLLQCKNATLECPRGYVNCAGVATSGYAQCAPSAADCPSKAVGPPGTVLCDDGASFARNSTFCFNDVASIDCTGQTKCFDGRCVDDPFDCPTRPSCGSNMVVCSDGSCQSSQDMCPSQTKCNDGLKRCFDGSCRSSLSDCPTRVTCPVGQVLCENNMCAASLSECKPAQQCGLDMFRCGDGSCAVTIPNCPTRSTCPDTRPVRCDDGSCAGTFAGCSKRSYINSCDSAYGVAGLVRCPDGSCSKSFATCSSGRVCPRTAPVMCSDGSCQSNGTLCNVPRNIRNRCPATLPVTCPGGSCRSTLSQCPSYSRCPDSYPVKCEDGSCVASSSYCEDKSAAMGCPDGQYRCPYGCAPNAESCASILACPVSNGNLTLRCVDGTCRSDCSSVTYRPCPQNKVSCPSPVTGFDACSNSLSDCPTGFACPSSSPVMCLDGTCVGDSSQCPSWPSSYQKLPCPFGGWQLSAGSCGTPVTCPNTAPYKCQDETCRQNREDCPSQSERCPETSPYRCQTGDCVSNLEDCPSTALCTDPGNFPVKCGAVNSSAVLTDGTSLRCVTSSYVCDDGLQSATNDKVIVSACPNRWTRCRDTTCVDEAASLCDPLSCPLYLPYLCDSGVCAANSTVCPAANGCPADRPYKCSGGTCAATAAYCPDPAGNCTAGQVRCPDGSCATALGSCPNANGCLTGQTRCLDGTCVAYDPTAEINPGINYCTVGQTNEDSNNACPYYQPYRCEGGLCALSADKCPVSPYNNASDVECPMVAVIDPVTLVVKMKRHAVRCADGSCVDSEIQCPTLSACSQGNVRCADGTCRGDESQCPSDSSCPASRPYRCTNGACADSLAGCVSPVSRTGCPCASTGAWNSEGYCTNELTKCDSMVVGGLCASSSQCSTQAALYTSANGCNATSMPYKCWDGECAASESACRARNGCPASMPIRCQDGTCQSTAGLCTGRTPTAGRSLCGNGTEYDASAAGAASTCGTYSGCPISMPYRCSDGSCAKYRAFTPSPALTGADQATLRSGVLPMACPTQLVCPSDQPYRCADYSCASAASECPPVVQCPDAGSPYICPDLSCAADAASCAATNASCPKRAPVLCPDGSCRDDIKRCVSEAVVPECADGQVLCFDGACRNSSLACITFAYLLNNPSAVSFDNAAVDADTGVCPDQGSTKMAVCPDGSCVPASMKTELCPATERCPDSLPLRCGNSECRAATATCAGAAAPTCSNPTRIPCADGTCRVTCPPSNGCSGSKPYYCPAAYTSTSFCVEDKAQCDSVTSASRSASRAAGLLMYDHEISMLAVSASNTPPTCTGDNCNRDVSSMTQTITLDSSADTTVDMAVSQVDNSVRGQLFIPAGALMNGTDTPTFTIQAVSDDELRSAINYVHRSRQAEYTGVPDNMFTMEQTVLSPAFKCVASADPFDLKVQFIADLDNSALINPGTSDKTDICLAVIYPSSSAWVCVDQLKDQRLEQPIVNTSDTRFVGKGQGFFQTCLDSNTNSQLVFAYAHIPLQANTSQGERNYKYFIQVVAVLVVTLTATLVLVVFWLTKRAARYRVKAKAAQKRIDFVESKLIEEKIYGGGLGRHDQHEEVEMNVNPMAVEFQNLEDQIKEYKEQTGYYEAIAKKQTSKIETLEGRRDKLENAVKNLRQQLAEQRHRIKVQKRLREQQATASTENANVEVAAAVRDQEEKEEEEDVDSVVSDGTDSSESDLGRDERI